MADKLIILGAGESGQGAALLGAAKGFEVLVSDNGAIESGIQALFQEKGIAWEEKGHSEKKILAANLIVKSPGIPDSAPIVKKAMDKGIPVISEIEFGSRYARGKIVAITGSNGKTTTTLLTYHLLKSAGFSVEMAGNVGESFARKLVDSDPDWWVLEVSSFQLDNCYDFRPHFAILLNITPDHLDRYDHKFQNYVDSKFRIAQNQTEKDYFISFFDDPVITKEIGKREIEAFKLFVSLGGRTVNGAFYQPDSERLQFTVNNHVQRLFGLDLIAVPFTGKHNYINCMSAVLVASCLGVKENVIEKALASFKNHPHRLEEVSVVNRVRFVNDSKATNVDSVKYALDSFDSPIIWIAGGVDKGNDYTQLEELAYEKVKALICLGKDNSKLKEAFGSNMEILHETEIMDEAVRMAYELADRGDIVLLSPACASFDLFNNYEHRGEEFKRAVKSIERQHRNLNLMGWSIL